MKKLFALLLALALLCSLTAAVFAEESYTITITAQTSDHIYEAYQVFTGTLSTDGKLSDIVWGDGVNADELLGALKADTTVGASFTDCTDAASVAKAIGELNNAAHVERVAAIIGANLSDNKTTSVAVEGEDNTYTITVAESGYYFIKDKDGTQADHDAYTEFMLQVVNSVEVAAKMDVPVIEKKIKDINDTTGETSDWQDSADYDIGNTIPYQITATLAGNVSKFDTYWIEITDTMTKGLTYNGDAKVYIDDVEAKIDADAFVITSVTDENGETVLTVTCANVKALGATDNSVIRVEYTCTLNENAVVGAAGNPNSVIMEYSNNPNEEQGGDKTGTTPIDTVIAFTYKVVVDKIDEEEAPLAGAEFILEKLTYGEAGEGEEPAEIWTSVGTAVLNEAGTQFTFRGLDDGTYRLTETVTPDGYNKVDPIVFTVTAVHDALADTPALTELSGDPFTGNVETGALSTNVINHSGTTLPGTGGIGTTLFYAVGGLLLLGAVVLLVTKKRVDVE